MDLVILDLNICLQLLNTSVSHLQSYTVVSYSHTTCAQVTHFQLSSKFFSFTIFSCHLIL